MIGGGRQAGGGAGGGGDGRDEISLEGPDEPTRFDGLTVK